VVDLFLAPIKREYIITFKNMDYIYRNRAVKWTDLRFLSLMTFVLAAVLSSCFLQSPFHVY